MSNRLPWVSILCFIVTTILILPTIAGAYTIDYFAVQYRIYQDTTKGPNDNGKLNRATFQIKNSSGAYVTKNLLTSVALYDPSGNKIDGFTLDNIEFTPNYTEVDGAYDGTSGIWNYGNPYSPSDFAYIFAKGSVLKVGTYQLEIVFDGESLQATWAFNGRAALPYVNSDTIVSHLDNKGNLVAAWSISDALLRTFPSKGTSARAMIDVYKKISKTKQKLVGVLIVRVPTAGGNLFVPKSLVTSMKSLGTIYDITIQIRTNDNCNRVFSKAVTLSLTK
jgi:hypothetical protein